jgi:hypothetical protein
VLAGLKLMLAVIKMIEQKTTDGTAWSMDENQPISAASEMMKSKKLDRINIKNKIDHIVIIGMLFTHRLKLFCPKPRWLKAFWL